MRRRPTRKATKSQNGYALLLVVFLVAVLALTVAAARPNLIIEGRREKEVEMIWRGKQYVRGIRLYYLKLHHFPTQLDDLYTPKTGIRFMRKPYKDPMNAADGTWRIIYAGPNGQIIGSLTQPTIPLISNTNPASGLGSPISASSSSLFGGTKNPFPGSASTSSFSSSTVAPASCQTSPNPANPFEIPGAAGLSNIATPQCSNTLQPAADPADANLTSPQNAIIGVGSKIKKSSIIWFNAQKDYQHFEFIWRADIPNPDTVIPNP